jgi:hypothetical protein
MDPIVDDPPPEAGYEVTVRVRSCLLNLHYNETIVMYYSFLCLIITAVERRKCGTQSPGITMILRVLFDFMIFYDTSCSVSRFETTELLMGERCILMAAAGPGLSSWGHIRMARRSHVWACDRWTLILYQLFQDLQSCRKSHTMSSCSSSSATSKKIGDYCILYSHWRAAHRQPIPLGAHGWDMLDAILGPT